MMIDDPTLNILIVSDDVAGAQALQRDLAKLASVRHMSVEQAQQSQLDGDLILMTELSTRNVLTGQQVPLFWLTDAVTPEAAEAAQGLAGIWLRPWLDVEVRRFHEQLEQIRKLDQLTLFEQTCASAIEAIVITDAQLDKPGPHIVYVNDAFCKMTGYNKDEVIGQTPRLLQGVGTDFDMLKRLRQSLENGHSFQGETVNHRKDGRPYIVEWNIEGLRDDDGKVTHYASTQRDLTERKRLGDTLKRVSSTLQEARTILGLSDSNSTPVEVAKDILNRDAFQSESVDLVSIDNTLRRLAQRARLSASFSGQLEGKGGARNLLQSLAMLRLQGVLDIGAFRLYLHGRHLVHLEHPNYSAEEGLRALLKLQEGNFRFEPNVSPERETLHVNLMGVLLEPRAAIETRSATPEERAIVSGNTSASGSTNASGNANTDVSPNRTGTQASPDQASDNVDDSQDGKTLVVPDIASALVLIASQHSQESFQVEGGYYPTQDKTYVTFRSPNLAILALSGSVTDVPKDILRNNA
ncbi:MAG: PAS domain-containing protein [Deinococcota bacterium]